MAFDLYKLTPLACPESTDYFFKETLRKVVETNEKLSFQQVMKSLSENKEFLKNYFSYEAKEGVILLVDLIEEIIYMEIPKAEFENRTGINLKGTISISNFALLIFHQLKAKAFLN